MTRLRPFAEYYVVHGAYHTHCAAAERGYVLYPDATCLDVGLRRIHARADGAHIAW
jgi:hypothetical protein